MSPFDPRLPIIAALARVKTCHVFHCWQAMKEMGRQFHEAAFAQFAGLENRHVSAIIAALAENDALPEKRATTPVRAHRLPDDWTCPPDWLEWASLERRWSPFDAAQEAEVFANYWQAKSGQTATKLDWKKTWHNWVRNSRRPNGDYSAAPTVSPQDFRASQERTAELYDRMGRTQEAAEIRQRMSRDNVIPLRLDTPDAGGKRHIL